MRKDSRLSFRISPRLSSRIDLAVKKSKGEIKDRSEFGTKAVDFYLNHLLSSDSDTDLIGKSILAIADKINATGTEFQVLRDLIYDDEFTPIENHPKFEELMILRERLPREQKKELSKRLFTAKYGELDKIFDEFSKKYYLEGNTEQIAGKHKLKAKAT